MPNHKDVADLIEAAGGRIDAGGILPDGSGFASASFPLPSDHWLYKDDGFEPPPMPMRMGTDDERRKSFETMIRTVAKYAVRAATMKGKDNDFDPDALVQNMIVGLLGYYTPDGLDGSEDGKWSNPQPAPPEWPR